MKTIEQKFETAQGIFFQLHAEMPVRIWIEGDGTIYATFQSNDSLRVKLSPFDAIQLVHKAHVAASKLISI